MPAWSAKWSVRELFPGDDDFIAALNLAITSCSKLSDFATPAVRDLLDSQSVCGLRVRPVAGTYEHNILRLAVAVVESPGTSNLFLLPFELASDAGHAGGLAALQFALKRSKEYGVSLSQVVGPEKESNWDVVLEEAGFSRLTELVYMSLLPNCDDGKIVEPRAGNGSWITYSNQTEPLFCEAIERSYVASMDCPEIAKMRTAQQSLMSHRAVGIFDPAKWFVLREGDRPLGVLLLNRVRNERAMEVVYMGVSQAARGKGVGDLLMQRALSLSARESTSLILAVDSRNDPAKQLYARWGFVEIARRAAWIASACGVGR